MNIYNDSTGKGTDGYINTWVKRLKGYLGTYKKNPKKREWRPDLSLRQRKNSDIKSTEIRDHLWSVRSNRGNKYTIFQDFWYKWLNRWHSHLNKCKEKSEK